MLYEPSCTHPPMQPSQPDQPSPTLRVDQALSDDAPTVGATVCAAASSPAAGSRSGGVRASLFPRHAPHTSTTTAIPLHVSPIAAPAPFARGGTRLSAQPTSPPVPRVAPVVTFPAPAPPLSPSPPAVQRAPRPQSQRRAAARVTEEGWGEADSVPDMH